MVGDPENYMRQYILDAFTETKFRGNPAAVVLVDTDIHDDL